MILQIQHRRAALDLGSSSKARRSQFYSSLISIYGAQWKSPRSQKILVLPYAMMDVVIVTQYEGKLRARIVVYIYIAEMGALS